MYLLLSLFLYFKNLRSENIVVVCFLVSMASFRNLGVLKLTMSTSEGKD